MRVRFTKFMLVLLLGSAAGLTGHAQEPFGAVDLRTALSPAALAVQLASDRVVFVGETHPRYADHLNQLAIIEQLYARDPNMAIGVEYFQQRFQPALDDYVAGRITEQDLVRKTEYYRRWGYDYRLYEPILRFARERHIPVRALNVPTSLPSAVARSGIAGLTPEQRAELPRDMQPASPAYRARLREAFDVHQGEAPGAFDHFVEAQLVWDEGMAESAAAYLRANPDRRMVVLAGSGHLEFGSGIPQRLARRLPVSYAIVLNGTDDLEPKVADYLLISPDKQLPPAGVLGVNLDEADGRCRVRALTPGGAAERSGVKQGDVLATIDGQSIKATADVRTALWDKKPGDVVHIEVRHKRFLFGSEERSFDITLSAPPKTTAG